MLWFTIATLTPVALLASSALFGGVFCWLALAYQTVFVHVLDRLVHGAAARQGADGEFPVGDRLAVVLGLAHLVLIWLAVYAIGGPSGLRWAERLACFIAFGLFFGQVSNANAHELIHKQARWPRQLGILVYISLLFGHHASAHPKVHHVWVASDRDPNSPSPNESFYHFWPRAWIGSFREGFKAENAMRARSSVPLPAWTHPYVAYVVGALGMIAFSALAFGWGGVSALVLVTSYAQMQLLLSDYVQHYGLRRATKDNGKLEPVGPQHSWNTPHFYSSALMLNAPRHSDHHMNPLRTYPSLRLEEQTMPVLPRSLPIMATLAMWPRKWRQVMNRRVEALENVE